MEIAYILTLIFILSVDGFDDSRNIRLFFIVAFVLLVGYNKVFSAK